MGGLIVGGQTFECVIKAFRLGREARRSCWPKDSYIYWDAKQNCIYYTDEENMQLEWYPEYLTHDIMATDWEVYAI